MVRPKSAVKVWISGHKWFVSGTDADGGSAICVVTAGPSRTIPNRPNARITDIGIVVIVLHSSTPSDKSGVQTAIRYPIDVDGDYSNDVKITEKFRISF